MLKNDLLPDFSKQVKRLCAASLLSEFDFHIALSGGLDSVVLLHLFARLREKEGNLTVSAHHINHGLSVNAVAWADFCSQLCCDLAIDFSCSCVCLQKKSRTSLEALAREKRYACLTQGLSANSYLVSAHHQDDQLETVLLALKRGSGNTGLQGIRSKQPLKIGYLIRPLLDFSRLQLEAYAQFFGLQWIEDESNKDQIFDRNYIRHTISPLLKARWPAIAKTVARSASICQEQQQLLDEIAQLDFTRCVYHLLNQNILDINELKALSVARRNNVLRYWFKQSNLNYPSSKQLLAVWDDMVLAGDSASPLMQFKGVTLRRYRDHLYLVEEQAVVDFNKPITWQGESQLSLLGGRVKLNFQLSTEQKDGLAIQPHSQVEICFRAHFPAKLACTPIGRSGSRSVKKLLHEYHVPPWLRDDIPFVFIDGKLQQAVGLWQCQVLPADNQKQYLMVFFA
jgi:tRNA(Ile)-lysidine synthase